MPTQFETPQSSSDKEFLYMATGMLAGAIPGVLVGLLLSLSLGHAAMWVSIVGGIGIILGLVISSLLYKKKYPKKKS